MQPDTPEELEKQARIHALILRNKGLVGYVLKRYFSSCYRNYSDWEELDGIGTLALVKAANWYDKSRGFAESTYLVVAIRRCIAQYMHRNKLKTRGIKLHSFTTALIEEIEYTLEDKPNTDHEEQAEKIDEWKSKLPQLYELMNARERRIFELMASGKSRREVGQILGISATVVGKNLHRFLNMAREMVA